jgi:hypothetical protein
VAGLRQEMRDAQLAVDLEFGERLGQHRAHLLDNRCLLRALLTADPRRDLPHDIIRQLYHLCLLSR